MTVTIIENPANHQGAIIIAQETTVGHEAPRGEAAEPVPFMRIRKLAKIDPAEAPALLSAGRVALDDVCIGPPAGVDRRLGADDGGVADLAAGTMTWTWRMFDEEELSSAVNLDGLEVTQEMVDAARKAVEGDPPCPS